MPSAVRAPRKAKIFDVVIAGGGHNGLVCAAYLAKAGLRVKVLERRAIVGGAAVTEEFYPGFRNSTCAYSVSLLNPKVIADLDLARHGLKIVERPAMNFLPLPDGLYLLTGPGRTKAEIAKFSAKDAAVYDDYCSHLERLADTLRAAVLQAPPNLPEGFGLKAIGEFVRAGRLGNAFRQLGRDDAQALIDLFTLSAADFLSRWFESEPIKALLGFDAVVGTYASPFEPGTAYVLLHHCFGEVGGKKGLWGHAMGGMGAVTQAMAKSALGYGAKIQTDAEITGIALDGDRACGVVLASGETIEARCIAANMTLKHLYTELVPAEAVPAAFLARMKNFTYGSGTFRMNLALARLPNFSARPGNIAGAHHGAGIVIAPSLDYMDRAYRDARALGWSREPIIEMLIPTTIDRSLAPPGTHVASLFCQHVAPRLPDGRSWDEAREEVADLMVATVERIAPGFSKSVIARQVLTPLDLEREFGLTGGDIFHGQLKLNQLFSARPMLGYADYRGPVSGLYHCGSGAHPGGGVTGAPGHNAARAILRDLKPFSSWLSFSL